MVKISTLQQQRIRKVINETIEIYNPDKTEMESIINLFKKYIDEEKKEIKIDGMKIIREFLPVLSNIVIDTMTDEELQEIIDNPSYELELAVEEVGNIAKEISNKIFRQTKIISELTAEQVMEMLKLDDIKMTDEEIEQLKTLEEKARLFGVKTN